MVKLMTARHTVQEQERKEQVKKQKEDYFQFLNQQRLEKLQQKSQDQTLKRHEHELIQQKEKVLKEMSEQKDQEERSYQNYLKSQY